MGEEYVADSLGARDDRLLPAVSTDGADAEFHAALTIAQFIGIAFGMAVTGAAGAVQKFVQWSKCVFGDRCCHLILVEG